MARIMTAVAAAILLAPAASAQTVRVERVEASGGVPMPVVIGGRVDRTAGTYPIRRQWPGTYMEARFRGRAASFAVGPGDVALRVSVDGGAPVPLVKPAPGTYRVDGLSPGTHRLRIDVVSESQAGATSLGGFRAPRGTTPLAPLRRSRQIEFIGDSHTVGYGNTAARHDCSPDEVWATTDTARGIAALTAARYGADYQVNAISGRGIVRNYGGAPGATVPAAYPFALLEGGTRYRGAGWHPSVIVIGLGTNDFSTPLRDRERWRTRDALREDYVATYTRFVRSLRARNPRAFFVLWATDLADGEIAAQAAKVADRLRRTGERRIAFVEVTKLALTGCQFHPDLADDRRIAAALSAAVDARPDVWPRVVSRRRGMRRPKPAVRSS